MRIHPIETQQHPHAARSATSAVVVAVVRALALMALLVLLRAPGGALTVTQQGNRVIIDGVPTALTFARGVLDPAQVPAYHALGFNTLLVRIDSPGSIALEKADALIAAGEREGLYLLLELANGSWSAGQRADLHDEDYVHNVTRYLQTIVPHISTHPRLVGWIISTVEEGRLVCDLGTFGQFLTEKYETLAALNDAWSLSESDGQASYRSHIPSFDVLTVQNAPMLANSRPAILKLVKADIEEYRKLGVARDADFHRFLAPRYPTLQALNQYWDFKFTSWDSVHVETVERRNKERPNSSPRSLLDLATYRAGVPRGLLAWWVEQVRAADAHHLVFAGGQRSYRTLSNLPDTVSGAFTECYPGVAEVDEEHHNPQAIDIARHGNRYIALAGISARHVSGEQLVHYLYTAALHGAAGVGVQDWATLAGADDLREPLRIALDDLNKRALLNQTPTPRVAMVYTPYAPGKRTGGGQLYGYMPGFISDGPGMFYFTLRQGTCYGQLDYLAPDDLPHVTLSAYQTLLLLSVLDLPVTAQKALSDFVLNGGTALADLGLGTMQAIGDFQQLPPKMMELFRVMQVAGLTETRLNLQVYRSPVPEFPSLISGLRTTGLGDGYAVVRSAQATPIAGADLLFTTVASRQIVLPSPRPYQPLSRQPANGMFIARPGKGVALYTPCSLYQAWLPGFMVFEEFHRDLFGRGAAIALDFPIDFLPAHAAVATFADGRIALWGQDQSRVSARLLDNPRREIYTIPDGWCEIGPDGTRLRCEHGGFHLAERAPITLDPAAFVVSIAVTQNTPQGLVVDIGADDANSAQPVTLRVGSGATAMARGMYVITPGSQHQVTMVAGDAGKIQQLQADDLGILRLTVPARSHLLITGPTTLTDTKPPQSPPPTDDNHEILIEAEPDGAPACQLPPTPAP